MTPDTSTSRPRKERDRPFPWPCGNCLREEVYPETMPYAIDVKHDGQPYHLEIPALRIPKCRACGELVFSNSVDDQVLAALRAHLRLLTPEQIRGGREALGLKAKELAEKLGVAAETISRWECGGVIQSRAMDNFLRVFFAVPEVRNVLNGAQQDPGLGTTVATGIDLGGKCESHTMVPDIRWITPLYGFGPDCDHIGAPENARAHLQEMAAQLIETSGLVAIYIPEGAPDFYQPGGKRGRVIGAVRLVKMPPGRKMEDYYYDDWDGSRRWPIGWPCEVVYAPDESECPFLREHVEHLFGSGTFGNYAKRFQHGPFELEPAIRERLNRDFAQFEQLE